MESLARVPLSSFSPELIDREVVDTHARANDVHVHLLPEAEFAPQDAEARVQNAEGALDGGARPANGVGEKSVNTVGGGARGGGGARTYLL